MPTASYLDRPGGRIACDVAGASSLVNCVLGVGDMRSVYRLLARALADVGFRVATMELRGHGDSHATFDTRDDVAAGTDIIALAGTHLAHGARRRSIPAGGVPGGGAVGVGFVSRTTADLGLLV